MATNKCVPWKDGNYKLSTMNNNIFVVNGEDVKMETLQGPLDSEFSLGTWKFGDFEEAHPEVAKETGKKNTNVLKLILQILYLITKKKIVKSF